MGFSTSKHVNITRLDYQLTYPHFFQELSPILKIADSLRIRGLTTSTSTSTSTSLPVMTSDVIAMPDDVTMNDKDSNEDPQIIHSKPSKGLF